MSPIVLKRPLAEEAIVNTPPLAGCAESSTTLGAEDPTVPDKNSPRPFVGGNQGRSRIRAPGESPDAIEKLGNELQ
ncbi:hypothetical protein POX_a01694 [Penicillium oxalicum]|uniref:hypothetical protein n=1 Tax=Penicillium oxalicum TaxID=69781 RepID=UPI0020B8BAB4|nr:hypothetical protein POX_a01694 [Penicillium oxalicum]KAI2795090.1 hypothetical protein POX_a01694 [Penicillium oxalicum]